jgi:hypothetical protein
MKLAADENGSEIGGYVRVSRREVRRAVLALLHLAADQDNSLADTTCSLIVGICQSAAGEGAVTAPIRSGLLDATQIALCSSDRQHRRDAGIALYSVRPPRSAADWKRIAVLLQSAGVREFGELWTWVIPVAAEVSNQPEPWIRHLTVVLESGVSDEISIMLSDLLRGLLEKQSQSLEVNVTDLGLPRIDK